MNKFKHTIKLFEEDVFKAASFEDSIKRKQKYALIQKNIMNKYK